jgi:hypothetical protein
VLLGGSVHTVKENAEALVVATNNTKFTKQPREGNSLMNNTLTNTTPSLNPF